MERWKGLGQRLYCKIGKRTRIKWDDPGHMAEDRYIQAGEKSRTEEAEEEGQREAEAPSLSSAHLRRAHVLGDEACLGFQPWSLHCPFPLGARTAVSHY